MSEVIKILYNNSTDTSEGMLIRFEKIQSVVFKLENMDSKYNQDWFNEFQSVEDYIIKKLGNKFKDMDLSDCKNSHESVIKMLEEIFKNL